MGVVDLDRLPNRAENHFVQVRSVRCRHDIAKESGGKGMYALAHTGVASLAMLAIGGASTAVGAAVKWFARR
ncbi:hypothetical protein KNE206_69630 [Kitasatospora sp. NE20-6]